MDNVIRGANWYFDAINASIALDEVELPELKDATEAFMPAGGRFGLDMPEGMSPLSAKIKMKNNDPRIRAMFGREPGNWVTSYCYERLTSYVDGANKQRIVVLRGLLGEIKDERKKGMKPTGVEYAWKTIVLYKDVFDGRVIHHYDWFNPGATLVDGVAVLAEHAQILAL